MVISGDSAGGMLVFLPLTDVLRATPLLELVSPALLLSELSEAPQANRKINAKMGSKFFKVQGFYSGNNDAPSPKGDCAKLKWHF